MDLKSLAPAALALVVVAIVFAVGGEILGNTQASSTSSSVANDTVSSVYNTATYLGHLYVISSTLIVTNATTGETFTSDNYTLNANAGTITNDDDTDSGNWNFSYDYTTRSVTYNATEYGKEGLEEFGSWLPTLALIMVAAVIIGTIAYFYFNRRY